MIACQLQRLSGHVKRDLLERIATVNKQSPVLHQRLPQPTEGCTTRSRVPTVQSAHPHSERKIIGPLPFGQDKILDRNTAKLQASCRELRNGARGSLGDSFGRAINGQDMPVTDAAQNGAGSDARAATNLQDAHSLAKRKRFDDRG